MNSTNIDVYASEARLYLDDKIIDAAISIAAKNHREVLISDEGRLLETSAFLDVIPETKKMELFRLAFVGEYNENRKFKRLRNDQGTSTGYDIHQSKMPRLGSHSLEGSVHRRQGVEWPIFYYDA